MKKISWIIFFLSIAIFAMFQDRKLDNLRNDANLSGLKSAVMTDGLWKNGFPSEPKALISELEKNKLISKWPIDPCGNVYTCVILERNQYYMIVKISGGNDFIEFKVTRNP